MNLRNYYRKDKWYRFLKMSGLLEIQLRVAVAGGINKFPISKNVMKEIVNEMFAVQLGVVDTETRCLMQENFFEILKDTPWFADFEKCILKNVNLFWRCHKNLAVPYWWDLKPIEDSVEMLQRIRNFLKEKLQLSEDEIQWL